MVVRQKKVASRVADLGPLLKSIWLAGTTSLKAIAAELNERGVPAPRGGAWHPNTVRRVLGMGGGDGMQG